MYLSPLPIQIVTISASTTQSSGLYCDPFDACVCKHSLLPLQLENNKYNHGTKRQFLSHRLMLSFFLCYSRCSDAFSAVFSTASLLHNINSDLTRCKIKINKYTSVWLGIRCARSLAAHTHVRSVGRSVGRLVRRLMCTRTSHQLSKNRTTTPIDTKPNRTCVQCEQLCMCLKQICNKIYINVAYFAVHDNIYSTHRQPTLSITTKCVANIKLCSFYSQL